MELKYINIYIYVYIEFPTRKSWIYNWEKKAFDSALIPKILLQIKFFKRLTQNKFMSR